MTNDEALASFTDDQLAFLAEQPGPFRFQVRQEQQRRAAAATTGQPEPEQTP